MKTKILFFYNQENYQLVYTDGVIDAPNPEGESFGLARLKDALDANAGAPLSELKSAVLKTLHKIPNKN